MIRFSSIPFRFVLSFRERTDERALGERRRDRFDSIRFGSTLPEIRTLRSTANRACAPYP